MKIYYKLAINIIENHYSNKFEHLIYSKSLPVDHAHKAEKIQVLFGI